MSYKFQAGDSAYFATPEYEVWRVVHCKVESVQATQVQLRTSPGSTIVRHENALGKTPREAIHNQRESLLQWNDFSRLARFDQWVAKHHPDCPEETSDDQAMEVSE